MIEFHSVVIQGKCFFNDIEEMWDAVAYNQARAWEKVGRIKFNENDDAMRYKVLEGFIEWRYAREVAEAAMKDQTDI